MWKRVPIGPCSFISPFNFPLNLAAHKIAPAIAMGCPFVMKPASKTPLGAIIMGEVLAECDVLPEGAFSILPASRDGADMFTQDERLKLLSFTGSPGVGWDLKAKAGKKKVVLELGGNAAVIIDKDADLADALERVIFGAFYQSGQSCIGVQRILIHADVYDAFKGMLVERAGKLVAGDPKDRNTFIGPMISDGEAKRLKGWIDEAVEAGATLLCGGGLSRGNMLEATLLENVPDGAKAKNEEAFGPLAILQRFARFDEALEEVNNSKFGLQAGIFTRDLFQMFDAWDRLEVGGVVINDVPSYRVDNMPYGGVKDSGLGREGIRFAMEDMSEIRNLVVRRT
jgi:acyl-CoA reductase-like NAD-dependent aldehyde dehydrogenase